MAERGGLAKLVLQFSLAAVLPWLGTGLSPILQWLVVPALAFALTARLESVRQLCHGLQSFRSMNRIEASLRKARALRLRHSQSLASRRQRLSHAMVRSTIQRFGRTTKPLT